MGNNKYLTLEFWESFFNDKGFERHIGFSCHWRFDPDRLVDESFAWWFKDDFVIGLQWNGAGKRPKLAFIHKPKSCSYVYVEKEFEFAQAYEILQDIESLSDPTLLPCCISDSWMGSIIESALIKL